MTPYYWFASTTVATSSEAYLIARFSDNIIYGILIGISLAVVMTAIKGRRKILGKV